MTPLQEFLDWRGIEVVCPQCHGTGSVCYGSTATWHGGIGGQALTGDVCDHCWGSGDDANHWADLRNLRVTEEKRMLACAESLLARRAGCHGTTMRPAIRALCELLRKEGKRRKPPVTSDWFNPWQRVCDALAAVLSEAVDAAEKLGAKS